MLQQVANCAAETDKSFFKRSFSLLLSNRVSRISPCDFSSSALDDHLPSVVPGEEPDERGGSLLESVDHRLLGLDLALSDPLRQLLDGLGPLGASPATDQEALHAQLLQEEGIIRTKQGSLTLWVQIQTKFATVEDLWTPAKKRKC